ncbi:hypothetical protein [Dyella tabacisoli]|uniref:hypothetical protein n=1 Tax=Dyella tabacisoli TaxID=2282381 RepID=UPI0036D29598
MRHIDKGGEGGEGAGNVVAIHFSVFSDAVTHGIGHAVGVIEQRDGIIEQIIRRGVGGDVIRVGKAHPGMNEWIGPFWPYRIKLSDLTEKFDLVVALFTRACVTQHPR